MHVNALHRLLFVLGLVTSFLITQGSLVRASEPLTSAARKPQIPELKVEHYRLPNGLRVILHEDHKATTIALYVCYLVGSKDEKPGKTGLAHLFEHLMFEGSEHSPERYANLFADIGGDPNAMTSEDRTVYFETFPNNGLEMALWLEADRMGFLLPAITQEELDNEREIIRNEQFERIDSAPYGRADDVIREAMYPPGHPYRHSIGGSMADLSAARVADVDAFYHEHYAPNNAVLCLAGDFKVDRARSLIKKYFSFTAVGRGAGQGLEAERREPACRPAHHHDRPRNVVPCPVALADRALLSCRRAGARRPGGRAGRDRQSGPPLPPTGARSIAGATG